MKKTTKIIKIDRKNTSYEELDHPAKVLREGGLVVFPTETVYGLGANAFDDTAVESIFKAKGRPSDNPLIVHISDVKDLENLVAEIPKGSKVLIEKFWPGPLTLLFEKSDQISSRVSAGLKTLAVRMPDDDIALQLIKKAKRPIAAPSANTSGKPSPTNAKHVMQDLDGKVDIVIDGGMTGVGIESTVLDLTEDIPTILRPGAITYEELVEVLGQVKYDPAIENIEQDIKPKSPGQKYRHYSPKAKMEIYTGDNSKVIQEINEKSTLYDKKGKKIGIMTTDENVDKYNLGEVLSMGDRKQLKTIATNLFHVLREFDKLDVDIILAEGVEETQVGKAIMNRMLKAAGGNITYLK